MANFPPHDPAQDLPHLRELRDAVVDVLKDLRLTADQKLEAIELRFSQELDEEEDEEDARDRKWPELNRRVRPDRKNICISDFGLV